MRQLKVVNDTKVIFGPVRLSYTHVFKPYIPDGETEGKYQTNVLIPKSETEAIKAIQGAIKAAIKAGEITKFGGKVPSNLDNPLRDGADKDDDVYGDCYYVNAKSKTKPGLISKDHEIITDEEEIYSGVWANVSVTFYAYNFNGKKGIACGLNNIMKVKDGERLGGRVSADTDFGSDFDFEDDDDL